MAIKYVDGNLATGSNNGTSWANAWKTLGAMTGLSAGDTVYISGGASGGTCTYNLSGEFSSLSGYVNGSGATITTYQIGQDSLHNGTATFNCTAGSPTQFLYGVSSVRISGDAGDGAEHFALSGNYAFMVNCVSGAVANIYLGYIACGSMNGFGQVQQFSNLEIDHCSVTGNAIHQSGIFYGAGQVSAYDDSKFHHCTIGVNFGTGGFGTDCWQVVGNGVSIYNNTITGYFLTGSDGNHQDGWQGSGGSYIKIYNNRFTDLQNYCIFAEGFTVSGTYTHMRVYNNVCVLTSATGQSSSQQAIALSANASFPATDVVCANNIVDGYTSGNAYTFWTTSGLGPTPAAFINCVFENNVSINSGGNEIDLAVTSATNASVTSGNAPTYFTSWTSKSGSNVYTLLSGATPLIGTGTDASTYISSLDFVGATRSAPWDIGPYKFSGAPAAPFRLGFRITQV